jgi:hypothetical protein
VILKGNSFHIFRNYFHISPPSTTSARSGAYLSQKWGESLDTLPGKGENNSHHYARRHELALRGRGDGTGDHGADIHPAGPGKLQRAAKLHV